MTETVQITRAKGRGLEDLPRAQLLDLVELAGLWGVGLEAMRSCLRRHGDFWATVEMVKEWPSGKRYWVAADARRHHAARDGKWPNNRGTGEVLAARRAASARGMPPHLLKAKETVRQAGAAAAAAGAAEGDNPHAAGWARSAWLEGLRGTGG